MHISIAHILGYIVTVAFADAAAAYGKLYIYVIAYLSTILIDIDHLPALRRYGLRSLMDFSVLKKYPLHNLVIYGALLYAGVLSFSLGEVVAGTAFVSVFLHMTWDLFDNIVIFRLKGWREMWL